MHLQCPGIENIVIVFLWYFACCIGFRVYTQEVIGYIVCVANYVIPNSHLWIGLILLGVGRGENTYTILSSFCNGLQCWKVLLPHFWEFCYRVGKSSYCGIISK